MCEFWVNGYVYNPLFGRPQRLALEKEYSILEVEVFKQLFDTFSAACVVIKMLFCK